MTQLFYKFKTVLISSNIPIVRLSNFKSKPAQNCSILYRAYNPTKGTAISELNFQYRNFHRSILSNEDVQKKRVALYDKEVKRQNSLITDIEKIEVHYKGIEEDSDCVLMMNKDISTPYNCAQHISNLALEQSVIAEVDGEIWDMFRPLKDTCTLRFLHFKQADPYYVNKAFWRSLSLMLGSILEISFNKEIYVQLCSFPSPQVRTGSFVYDVDIPLESWEPTMDEKRILSAEMVKLALANLPFHRLEVDAKLAMNIFEDNQYKKAQIPHIASQSNSGNDIVLYRIGNFIDISRGPAISHTRHMGKCTIAAVIPIETDQGKLFRVQGVALPKEFYMNHYSFSILEERARNINSSRIPNIESFHKEVNRSTTEYSLQE